MNPPFPEDDMEFSKYFDHTLLRPDATREDIRSLIDEALQYDFAAVCVNGCHVRIVEEALAGSGIRTAAVVGFPLGAMSAAAKAKILSNTHNGEIILLHPTSSTNAAILSELIKEWKSMGFRFATLDELKK